MKPGPPLTERQAKWFATVKANFEIRSGRTLEAWGEIARLFAAAAERG